MTYAAPAPGDHYEAIGGAFQARFQPASKTLKAVRGSSPNEPGPVTRSTRLAVSGSGTEAPGRGSGGGVLVGHKPHAHSVEPPPGPHEGERYSSRCPAAQPNAAKTRTAERKTQYAGICLVS